MPVTAVIRVVLCSFSVGHFNRKWSSSPVSDIADIIFSDAGGFGDLYLLWSTSRSKHPHRSWVIILCLLRVTELRMYLSAISDDLSFL